MKLTPTGLTNILNASLMEMQKHPNDYSEETKNEAKKLWKWVVTINWDEPDNEVIFIDELPY